MRMSTMSLTFRTFVTRFSCISRSIWFSVFNHVSGESHCKLLPYQYATKSTKSFKEEVMPQNPLKDLYSASQQTENGIIYDKKPFKMKCVPGKDYFWCLCGRSKTQPLCDGTHRSPYLKIKLRPIKFQVTEDKYYWLCNCKQTSNRPFCDGTHKREDIQAAVR